MAEDRFEELLGSYLLGELAIEEERKLEHHLEECPKCRHELDHVRQAHNLLRKLAATEPPAELKSELLAQVRGVTPGPSRAWWFWVSAAAAVLVVAVLVVGLLQVITGEPSSGVPLTATALAPEAGGEVWVEEVGENFQVELEVWGMPKLEEDEYYEMWYYAEDGGRLSCGTFRVGAEGRATVNLTAPASAEIYPEIEITREPNDGDPRASGEEILEGKLRSS